MIRSLLRNFLVTIVLVVYLLLKLFVYLDHLGF